MGRSDGGLLVDNAVKSQGEDFVKSALSHHGILGMRWGVRRTRAQLDAASDDASNAQAVAEKIKKNKGRTDSLSNKELQDFIARANLEKQFAQIKEEQGTLNKGERKLKKMLGRGKTIQEIYNFARSPLGKDLFKLIMKTTRG